MADLIVKLGSLFVKTLSKPIAKGLKSRITNDEKMTARCVQVGQWSHQFWSWVTIRAAGHKAMRVKPLDDAVALNTGAETISEIFIFSVAGSTICFEIFRSEFAKARESKKKKDKEEAEIAKLDSTLKRIEDRITEIEERQKELIIMAEDLERSRQRQPSPETRKLWNYFK